jgi:hypothetical protein
MTGLLYLAKNSIALYDEKTKGIFRLNFLPLVVKDLEIINRDQLGLNIKTLVESNKIIPSALIMVVSNNMFFEKDFPPLSKEQQVIETQKFLDNIPFEDIVSKAFGTEKVYKIVAANGHFIESIRKAFEALGFAINIAIPAIAFGNIGEELNQVTIKIIFSKYPALKQYNLLKNEPVIKQQPSQQEPEGEKHDETNNEKNNKKNLIAIGVFVLLIIIISIVVFFVLSSQSSSPKKTGIANTKLIVKMPIDNHFSV